ncbi:N-alpha-acetyltransferase mak3, partial [Ascosphaera acerosa]
IVLETETTNQAAMRLYSRLGFLRSKKLHRYYLNGNSAYRLVLYLKEGTSAIATYTATGCAQGQEGQEGRLAYEQQAEHGMHGGGTVV